MTKPGSPVATTDMLIHASPHAAFEAFRDPAQLTRFWLSHCSGPLEAGARVHFAFMVPGAQATAVVKQVEPDRLIAFDWAEDGTSVELRFEPHGDEAVHVTATVTGFSGDEAMASAIDATAGFSLVLCDLKVLLETGKPGGMVRDKAALIARCDA